MVTRKRTATAKVKTTPRYTTRSRKPTAKMKEAAPAYTARSRRAPSKTKKRTAETKRRSSSKKASSGEALWQYFLTLTEQDHGAFIMKMLEDKEWREDIMDIAVVMSQRNNPKDDYEEFEEELRSEGRL